jgi:uncharacterized membrane protein (UPF0127 family)
MGQLTMSSSFKIRAILARLRQGRADSPEVCIRVVNLTRGEVIADRVQLAGAGRDRRKGLLGRDRLGSGEGLWIVPCEAVHTIGMRFPIDLVYLDRQKRIVKLRCNVGPWRISGCLRAHSVIELPAGTVRDTNTIKGDMLALDYREPSSQSLDGRSAGDLSLAVR